MPCPLVREPGAVAPLLTLLPSPRVAPLQVLHSRVRLHVVASSLTTLSPVLLSEFQDPEDLAACLKASAAVPQLAGMCWQAGGGHQQVGMGRFGHSLAMQSLLTWCPVLLAGEPRIVRGDRLVDAAVFEPVPVRTAIADGCTHVLALCTRPATLHTTWHRRLVRGTVSRVVKRTMLNAPYMAEAWAAENSRAVAVKVRAGMWGACPWLLAACNHRRSELFNLLSRLRSPVHVQDEELVRTLAVTPAEAAANMGAYVLPIYPPHAAGCHPLTTNPQVSVLGEGRQAGTMGRPWIGK